MRSPKNAVSERTSVRAACMSPGDRFRRAVRKIIALRRGVGAEPGIDPRRQSAFLTYGHVRQNCLIEIADYSSVRSSFRCMTNSELIRLLADTRASAKEPWVKVRWINVGGISWDVISALAIKYGMYVVLYLALVVTVDDALCRYAPSRYRGPPSCSSGGTI